MGNLHFAEGSLFANRFEIEKPAGSGGMGTVYRARDRYSGARVALKLLHQGSDGIHEAERFAREAQLLSELRHQGIVAYVAHGQLPDGQRYLAMEWLEGEDLGKRLAQGPLPLSDCFALLKGAVEALALIHHRGIIHRDLKPTNLFLTCGDPTRIKLLDFGIARRLNQGMTRTGTLVGTPEYMAPEQARGVRDLTAAADIFSLGCVLYECLTGQPPFAGEHMAAVLVSILLEEPVPVEQRRADVPESLRLLLEKMLHKDPLQRFVDASALHAALPPLVAQSDTWFGQTLVRPAAVQSSFAESEQGLFSIVLAALSAEPEDREAPQLAAEQLEETQQNSLLAALSRIGIRAEFLVSGTLVATMPQLGSAKDQVTGAAQAALLIKEHWPAAVVSLATGRGAMQGRVAAGEVVERAARFLRRNAHSAPTSSPTPGIFVDELSARLLEGRFAQTPRAGGAMLLNEEKEADASRPLLGKPTPCVGREVDLAILEAQLKGCVEDSEARAVLIIAPSGIGKSRLRHEFLRRVAQRGEPTTVLLGSGDLIAAGAPYGILGQAVRRHCGLHGGEARDVQRAQLAFFVGRVIAKPERKRVTEFLGELCGVTFPSGDGERLLAARSDPRVMHEQIRRAFVEWLRAECTHSPVLLVLDDLQWGDTLSIGLLDAALGELGNAPLYILALARPEVREVFPKLWAGHQVQELPLKRLSQKAAERLVRQVLGLRVQSEVVAHVVEQSAGNAFFLEELIRATGEGEVVGSSDTVIAMLQARIGRFGPGLRRVVRAASVFGQTFWREGLAEILGISQENSAVAELDKWLEMLVDAEVCERHGASRLADTAEYGFRHALVREAAYALLTDSDLITGHRIAARFLEHAGEQDPLALVGHYQRAGEPERTVQMYMRAADVASRMWALPEARLHYSAAYTALSKLADSSEHRRYKVDVLIRQVQLGILADSIEHNLARLSEARSLLNLLKDTGQTQSEDYQRSNRIDLQAGRLHYYQGQYVEAVDCYARLLPQAEARRDEHLLAILTQSIGAVLMVQGQPGKGAPWLERAIALEGKLETDYERLRLRSSYACCLVMCGHYREGVALDQEVVTSAADSQRSAGLALAYLNRACMFRFCGDFSTLLESAKIALDQAQKSGDLMLVPPALALIGWAYSGTGCPQEANAYMAQAHQLRQEFGSALLLADWLAVANAEIALRAGDLNGAIGIASQMVPSLRKEKRFLGLGLAEQVWGLAIGHRDLTQAEESDTHLTAALQVMESSEQRLGAAILRLEWAQLCHRRGAFTRAGAMRARAVAQFVNSGCAHLIEGIERACGFG